MERLGYPMPLVLGVNMILTSLSKDYDQFVQNYNMHGMGKTIPELHAMLKLAEIKGYTQENFCCPSYKASNKKTKQNLDSTFLWHCPLGHINKKRIEKLQHDGLLESIDDEDIMTINYSSHVLFVGMALESDARILEYGSNKEGTYDEGFTETRLIKARKQGEPPDLEQEINMEIKKYGFTQNPDEPCVYKRASGSINVFLILYVDDILLIGNNIPMLQDVKSWLGKCFAMKDLANVDLRKSQGPSTPAEVKRMKGIPYVSVVGSIMYAVRCTRPDVAFSQNLTSRYQQNPGESHWTALKNILEYLRNTKDMFLIYSGDSTTKLGVTCYTDASWETDRDDPRSQTGFVFVMNGGAVDWKSSKQSTTAMSSMEAKYIDVAEAAMEAIWIRAITIADEPGVQKGGKHFRRKYHFIREVIQEGDIRILKVHTDNNLADPLTKPMPCTKHVEHARSIGLRPAVSDKPICVTPFNKESFQKSKFAPKTDEKNVLTKPVTSQTLPKQKKEIFYNTNVIAPGMYKVKTKDMQGTHENVSPSTRVKDVSSVERPKSASPQLKKSVLFNTKSRCTSEAMKNVETYVQPNKKLHFTPTLDVSKDKTNVMNVNSQNASKAKSNVMCVSCGQCLLSSCHDKCDAMYALFVNCNANGTIFTSPIDAKTRFLNASPIATKTRFVVVTHLAAKNKMSSSKPQTLTFKKANTPSRYMKNKAQTSRKWHRI
ncbi:retrotransposon protein, putative, ty1-copia subclass [Tanacetum coccineum]